jgi:putative membrane protein
MDFAILPHVNAGLNATSAVLLASGYYFIRRGRVTAHLRCMVAALVVSLAFLASYLVYHYNHGSTRFTGQGAIRPVYFTILLTHTVLAVVIVPLVVQTVRRAWAGQFDRHSRVARWTLPLWAYVSVTGVLVYLLLYQLYPSR